MRGGKNPNKNKLPEENSPPAFPSKLGPEVRDLSMNEATQWVSHSF